MTTENTYCVYCHTTPNGKRYIGLARGSANSRWRNGLGYKKQVFDKAIEKYGWSNIEHEIIYESLSKEQAVFFEKFFIKHYKSYENEHGYNMTLGGEGTAKYLTEEERKEARKESSRKVYQNSREVKIANSKNYYQQNRERVLEQHKIHDAEHKEEILAKKKIYWAEHKDERNAKRREKYVHVENPVNAPKVVIAYNENERIVFNSLTSASELPNVNRGNIRRAIRKGTRCGGYHWKYGGD